MSSYPILTTKLFIPLLRADQLPRPHLIEKLNEGAAYPLTLISASAGSGKTTLLTEWIAQHHCPTAWISLDAGDNDPIHFITYLIAALRTIQEDFAEDIILTAQSEQSEPLEAHLINLINAMAETMPDCTIVFDDFHTITDQRTNELVTFMVEHLPSHIHLVIATRTDPPWPLGRYRSRNQLFEIRGQDLRFNTQETADFLNHTMGLDLSADDVAALETRTEGWIAGLQLAALSIQKRDDVSAFVRAFTGSHRYIAEYLIEEILEQQPKEIQIFLLKTSVLERLNVGLCEMVVGCKDGQAILQNLLHSNIFMIPLDHTGEWFRYHPLFADLLKKQLHTQYADLIPELHYRASQWYAKAGYISGAIDHACKTDDWDFVAQQIETHIATLIQHGERVPTRQWLRLLPNEIIRSHPVLCVAQAWASAKFFDVGLAEELLSDAATMLSTQPPDESGMDPSVHQWVSSQLDVLQVMIARTRGDSTQRQQELALEALKRVDPINDAAARATLLFRLGLCYLDLGNNQQADRIFSKAVEMGRSSGNQYALHAANYGRMVIAKLAGRLNDLETLIHQTLDEARLTDDQAHSLAGIDLVMLGVLAYEWNQLDQAETYLTQGLALVQQVGIAELLIKGHFALACLKIAKGNLSALPDLAQMAEQEQPQLTKYAATLQARMELLVVQAKPDSPCQHSIVRWAEGQKLSLQEQSTYDWDMAMVLTYARFLCWQAHNGLPAQDKSRLRETLDIITDQRQHLQDLGWWGLLIEVEVISAIILQTLGENAKALITLDGALNFAEPQGFVRTFVDEGLTMRNLLKQASTQGNHRAYAQKLCAAYINENTTSRKPFEQNALLDPLSERELQVLRLLNTALNVPEIAAELHLAPTTVRTHIRKIYSKLGVHGRIEALQKAEEFNLF